MSKIKHRLLSCLILMDNTSDFINFYIVRQSALPYTRLSNICSYVVLIDKGFRSANNYNLKFHKYQRAVPTRYYISISRRSTPKKGTN